jgi:hypothetical protein
MQKRNQNLLKESLKSNGQQFIPPISTKQQPPLTTNQHQKLPQYMSGKSKSCIGTDIKMWWG